MKIGEGIESKMDETTKVVVDHLNKRFDKLEGDMGKYYMTNQAFYKWLSGVAISILITALKAFKII